MLSWLSSVSVEVVGGLIVFVIGLVVERTFGLTERLVKKTNVKVVQKATLKPHNTLFALFAWGNKQDATAEQESEVDVGTQDDALAQPRFPQTANGTLTSDAGFLTASMGDLLNGQGERMTLQNDLRLAGQYLGQNDQRGAATTLCRALGPVLAVLETRQHQQASSGLRRDVSKLEKWSDEGTFTEDVPAIVATIERTLHAYFRENR